MVRPGTGGALALAAGDLGLEAAGALAEPPAFELGAPGDVFATEGPAPRLADGTADPFLGDPGAGRAGTLPASPPGGVAGALPGDPVFTGAGAAFFEGDGVEGAFAFGGGCRDGAAVFGVAAPFAGPGAGFAPFAGVPFTGLRPAAGLAAPFADFPRAADRWVATCPVFSTSERARAPARVLAGGGRPHDR